MERGGGGTSSNSIAVARDLTSTHRHCARKAFSWGDSFSGFFSFGVPFVAMRYKAFNGSSSTLISTDSKKGGN